MYIYIYICMYVYMLFVYSIILFNLIQTVSAVLLVLFVPFCIIRTSYIVLLLQYYDILLFIIILLKYCHTLFMY